MSSPASSLREPTPDPPAPEVHLISHGNGPVKKHEELEPIKLRILQPSGPKCSYKVATVAVSGDYNIKNHTEGEEVGSLNSGAHRWDSRLRTDLDRLLLDHEANAYMKTTANWNVESKNQILVEESNPELPEGDRKRKWFVEDVVYTEPIEVVK